LTQKNKMYIITYNKKRIRAEALIRVVLENWSSLHELQFFYVYLGIVYMYYNQDWLKNIRQFQQLKKSKLCQDI